MEIVKRKVKKEIELLFEIGKTYKTKFQTGDMFTLTQSPYIIHKESGLIIGVCNQAFGIYEHRPHLGECPLNIDRLIPEKKFEIEEVDVFSCCGERIDKHECKNNGRNRN